MCVVMPVVVITAVSLAYMYRHRCACSGQEDQCGERSTMAHSESPSIEEADALVDGAAAVPQVRFIRAHVVSCACRPSHIGSFLGCALLHIYISSVERWEATTS